MIEFVYRLLGLCEWRAVGTWHDVVDIDGVTIPKETFCWRRRHNGVWQYRAMTQKELDNESLMWSIK